MPYKHPEHRKAYMKKWREKNKEQIRATRQVWMEKNRERALELVRQWKLNNPERVKAVKDRYLSKYGWPERKYNPIEAERRRERYRIDPLFREKCRARSAVTNAIRSGRLVKGVCAKCGSNDRIHGHHHDYSKPLDVEWLCYLHHRLEHKGRFFSRKLLINLQDRGML